MGGMLEEQKRLAEKMCQYHSFNSPGQAPDQPESPDRRTEQNSNQRIFRKLLFVTQPRRRRGGWAAVRSMGERQSQRTRTKYSGDEGEVSVFGLLSSCLLLAPLISDPTHEDRDDCSDG